MVNFLIVDDHDIIREGIKTLLETKASYTVIDKVSSGEEAYRFYTSRLEQPIDIILMDITMEGYGGFRGLKKEFSKEILNKKLLL